MHPYKAVVITSPVVEQHCVVYIICILISVDVWEPWLPILWPSFCQHSLTLFEKSSASELQNPLIMYVSQSSQWHYERVQFLQVSSPEEKQDSRVITYKNLFIQLIIVVKRFKAGLRVSCKLNYQRTKMLS